MLVAAKIGCAIPFNRRSARMSNMRVNAKAVVFLWLQNRIFALHYSIYQCVITKRAKLLAPVAAVTNLKTICDWFGGSQTTVLQLK